MSFLRGLGRVVTRLTGRRDDGAGADPRHVLGRLGEKAAADHLKKNGYTIVDRNVRLRGGEVDILAISPEEALVCVEVKTRTRDDWRGEWAINRRKQRQLIQLIQRIGKRKRWAGRRLRIDVIVVVVLDGQVSEIRHHKCAVTLNR
jgi:putative endonuclease